MNILSLFDGMSCGQIALNKLGIEYDNYFAAEIDKHAIKVTQSNYPSTKQLGDVTKWQEWDLPQIDVLFAGFPCQAWSMAGKQQGDNDPRGALVHDLIAIWKHYKPKYFLFENVKMKAKHLEYVNNLFGVEPIEINSALVSAQNRKRMYWTNIKNVTQPQDKGINLCDILEHKGFNKACIIGRRIDNRGKRQDYNKDIPVTQCLEVRKTNTNKSNCLTTVQKDNVLTSLPIGRHLNAFDLPFRYYTRTEYERLQTVPDGYTSAVSENQAKKMLGNGWTVDVIAHILKNIK